MFPVYEVSQCSRTNEFLKGGDYLYGKCKYYIYFVGSTSVFPSNYLIIFQL